MKKILSMVLVLLLTFSVVPGGVNLTASADSVASGKVGKYTWSVNKGTGVLKLTGSGNIIDFSSIDAPWKEYSDNITSLELPNTLTKIGKGAFSELNNLKSGTIPSSVTSIGDYAFADCSALTNITIPNSVTSIGNSAFSGCSSLTSITIPNNIASIGSGTFYNCTSLESVIIPNSVTSIKSSAFGGCSSLTNIAIPNSVTSIGSLAFHDCTSLESVTIPEGVTSIMEGTFLGCSSLKNITIPSSVIWIDNMAFDDCSSLENITIPYNVYIWGHGVFNGCDNLKEFYIYIRNYKIPDFYFNYNHTIYGFKGSTTEALAEKVGAEFIDIMTIHSHTYNNSCDADCNVCGATRKVGHTYKTTTVKATTKKNGSITKKCSKCGMITKNTVKYAKTFKLSTTSYAYNGRAKKPTVKVYDSSGKKLKNKTDYTVSYSKGCKNVGTYKVTVKMKGNYSGSKTLTFKINPKETTLKLTAGKNSMKVNIKKQSSQVTGYEIQYATNINFKSAKKKTIKSYKKTSLTLKSLKAKKRYYVRVRTYKTLNGKKYYSYWTEYYVKISKGETEDQFVRIQKTVKV